MSIHASDKDEQGIPLGFQKIALAFKFELDLERPRDYEALRLMARYGLARITEENLELRQAIAALNVSAGEAAGAALSWWHSVPSHMQKKEPPWVPQARAIVTLCAKAEP